ncbi:MAG TPA: hypothetical protein VF469_20495 [Kofleriaceae bacterium]
MGHLRGFPVALQCRGTDRRPAVEHDGPAQDGRLWNEIDSSRPADGVSRMITPVPSVEAKPAIVLGGGGAGAGDGDLSWQQVDLLPSLVRQPLAVEGKVTLDLGYGPITLPVKLEPVAF